MDEPGEVGPALAAEVVLHQRCIARQLPVVLILGIEHAQRVGVEAALAVFVQQFLVRLQMRDQPLLRVVHPPVVFFVGDVFPRKHLAGLIPHDHGAV